MDKNWGFSIKRKFFISSIITIMCFLLVGCGINNIGKKSNIELSENGISLSIKENTLTSTSVTLIYKNDSDKNVRYGEDYHIEIKKEGEWHYINAELVFNTPLWTLEPKSSVELELDWEHSYGELYSGEYRIVKGYNIETSDGKVENYNVAVEFTLI